MTHYTVTVFHVDILQVENYGPYVASNSTGPGTPRIRCIMFNKGYDIILRPRYDGPVLHQCKVCYPVGNVIVSP